MNPAQGQVPAQGQPQGQPQQQQAAGAAGQQPQQQGGPPLANLFQPAQIRQLTILSEDEKTKYIAGLEGLWAKIKSSPPQSNEYKQATEKIMNFSRMLQSKIQQRQVQIQQHRHQQMQHHQQQLQQQQQQQQQQGKQAPQQQQQQQRPQSQGQPQQQAQQAQQPQPSQTPRPPSANQQPLAQAPPQTQPQVQQPVQQQGQQQAGANAGTVPNAAGPPTAAGGQPQQQGAPQVNKLPDSIANHLRSIQFKMPPELKDKPQAEIAKYMQDTRAKYGRALLSIENAKNKMRAIERQVSLKASQGKPFTDDELRKINENKAAQAKTYNEASRWLEGFRKQHVEGHSGQSSSQPPSQQPQGNSQNGAQGSNQNTTAVHQQPAVAGASRASPANGTPTNVQVPNRNTPNPSQQAQSQIQGQKSEQAPPTPVNSGAPGQAPPSSAQGAGRLSTPGSSTPIPPGPGRPLSHSAAMSLANQRAATTAGNAQQVQAQAQPQAVGTPSSAGPAMPPQPSAAQGAQQPQPQHQQQMPQQQQPQQQQQQQQHGHPHAHPTQPQTAMHSKMPIPKQLPEKATAVPQGVTLGGGVKGNRPTFNQGTGTMGSGLHQPAMNRIPAYNNEAEGDHVLSKKKLDELVRQVCGGSSEGQEGNLLTPEVEENVLNMADSFVDNVLHAACRNAKERGSKVLEIRDIQLVLERTYNIRVPGYSSDDLRTVRKVQPSPGWIAKMSAVQAAKVMPGKGE